VCAFVCVALSACLFKIIDKFILVQRTELDYTMAINSASIYSLVRNSREKSPARRLTPSSLGNISESLDIATAYDCRF
jgi:hypothetical protein